MPSYAEQAPGTEFLMVLTGCTCDEYQADTQYVRCGAGWYGVPDEYVYTGCMRCPSYTNAAGEMFYGNSSPVANKSISGCWLEGSNAPFSDTTGIYDITTDKCMYIPETIVVPVEPGTGGRNHTSSARWRYNRHPRKLPPWGTMTTPSFAHPSAEGNFIPQR